MVNRLFRFALIFIITGLVWSMAAGLYIILSQAPENVSAADVVGQGQSSSQSLPISYQYSAYDPQWPLFNPGFYDYPPIDASH